MSFPNLSPDEVLRAKKQDKVWQIEAQNDVNIKKWREELNFIFQELLSNECALVAKLGQFYDDANRDEIDLSHALEDYYVNLKKEFEEPGFARKKHAMLAARALRDLNESSKDIETHPEKFNSALNIFHYRAEQSHIYPRLKIAALSILSVIAGYLLIFVVRLLFFVLLLSALGISLTPFAPIVVFAAIPVPYVMPLAGIILDLFGFGVMAAGIQTAVSSYKTVLETRNDGIYLANSIFKCLPITPQEKEEKKEVSDSVLSPVF